MLVCESERVFVWRWTHLLCDFWGKCACVCFKLKKETFRRMDAMFVSHSFLFSPLAAYMQFRKHDFLLSSMCTHWPSDAMTTEWRWNEIVDGKMRNMHLTNLTNSINLINLMDMKCWTMDISKMRCAQLSRRSSVPVKIDKFRQWAAASPTCAATDGTIRSAETSWNKHRATALHYMSCSKTKKTEKTRICRRQTCWRTTRIAQRI